MITETRISINRRRQGYYLRWWYNGWHYWQFIAGDLRLTTSGEKYKTYGTKEVSASSGQVFYEQIIAIRTILNSKECYILTDTGWRFVKVDAGNVKVYDNKFTAYELIINISIGSRVLSETGFSPIAEIPNVNPSPITYCEITIGTQIWMCKNWDSTFPGFKSYDMTIENKEEYGCLYSTAMITTPGFAPDGWHVPTLAEWQQLIDFVGGDALAGGALKEIGITHWDTPNTGAVDTFGFAALGGGSSAKFMKDAYSGLNTIGRFWTSSPDGGKMYAIQMRYDSEAITIASYDFRYMLSVRLIKDEVAPAITYGDWFLPSKDEAYLLKTVLYDYGVGSLGITNIFYVTSSEQSALNCYRLLMSTGQDDYSGKNDTFRVRAIRSFTSVTNYNLRDVGPAGGWIFYKNGNNYLEAASSDQSAIAHFSNITNQAIGTTGTAIGTGQANTTAIINQVGHTDSAAKLCNDLVIVR